MDVSGLLYITLDGIGNVSLPWIGAVIAFLQSASKNQFGRRLQDIQLHKLKLFGDLRDAGLSEIFSWTERSQDLDLAVSTASSALFDFLSELLGKATDIESVGRLLKSLSDIKSITPESYGFEALAQLLLLLTKLAVSSSSQRHSCEPLLKSLLNQLKDVIRHNKSKLLRVLQGTKLEAKFSKIEQEVLTSVHEESSFFSCVCLPETDACPLLITMIVCLMALFSVSELTSIQWQQIEVQLLQSFKSQQQSAITLVKRLMPQVCEAMQCEFDSLRDTCLTELMTVIPGENDHLQDLIASVFHY